MTEETKDKRDEYSCCGTCKYYTFKRKWICDNPKSDEYMNWTDYGCSCEEYETR